MPKKSGNHHSIHFFLILALCLACLIFAGCKNLPKLPGPQCCKVIGEGAATLGCVKAPFIGSEQNCNDTFSSVPGVVRTEWVSGDCSSFDDCSTAHCIGIAPLNNGSAYPVLINSGESICGPANSQYENKSYYCNVTASGAAFSEDDCPAQGKVCNPWGGGWPNSACMPDYCCVIHNGTTQSVIGCVKGALVNYDFITCQNYFTTPTGDRYAQLATGNCGSRPECNTGNCAGVMTLNNGSAHPFTIINGQSICGPAKSQYENKSMLCDAGTLAETDCSAQGKICDPSSGTCESGFADTCCVIKDSSYQPFGCVNGQYLGNDPQVCADYSSQGYMPSWQDMSCDAYSASHNGECNWYDYCIGILHLHNGNDLPYITAAGDWPYVWVDEYQDPGHAAIYNCSGRQNLVLQEDCSGRAVGQDENGTPFCAELPAQEWQFSLDGLNNGVDAVTNITKCDGSPECWVRGQHCCDSYNPDHSNYLPVAAGLTYTKTPYILNDSKGENKLVWTDAVTGENFKIYTCSLTPNSADECGALNNNVIVAPPIVGNPLYMSDVDLYWDILTWSGPDGNGHANAYMCNITADSPNKCGINDMKITDYPHVSSCNDTNMQFVTCVKSGSGQYVSWFWFCNAYPCTPAPSCYYTYRCSCILNSGDPATECGSSTYSYSSPNCQVNYGGCY